MPRDFLTEAREYAIGHRRALPDVALVVALIEHIQTLTDSLDIRDTIIVNFVNPQMLTHVNAALEARGHKAVTP